MPHPSRPLALVAALVLGAAAGPAAAHAPAVPVIPSEAGEPAGPLWMEMRDVRLHVDASAVMRVLELRGEAVPTTPGAVA